MRENKKLVGGVLQEGEMNKILAHGGTPLQFSASGGGVLQLVLFSHSALITGFLSVP